MPKNNKTMITVNERLFYIWKLEWWWVAFNSFEFEPENRKYLFKNVYWRL